MAPLKAFLVAVLGLQLAAAQWPAIDHAWVLPSATRWHQWSNPASTLPEAMRVQTSALLGQRRAAVGGLQSPADWRHRSASVRETFSQIFDYAAQADAPERRTPLNARTTKRTVHPTLNASHGGDAANAPAIRRGCDSTRGRFLTDNL